MDHAGDHDRGEPCPLARCCSGQPAYERIRCCCVVAIQCVCSFVHLCSCAEKPTKEAGFAKTPLLRCCDPMCMFRAMCDLCSHLDCVSGWSKPCAPAWFLHTIIGSLNRCSPVKRCDGLVVCWIRSGEAAVLQWIVLL